MPMLTLCSFVNEYCGCTFAGLNRPYFYRLFLSGAKVGKFIGIIAVSKYA